MENSTICEKVVKLHRFYKYLRSVTRKFGPAGLADRIAGRVVQVPVERSWGMQKKHSRCSLVHFCNQKGALAAVWCTFWIRLVLGAPGHYEKSA